MKKTLLAAALLVGFAGAGVAQAETSVTLYGILDTGYGYQNYKYDNDFSYPAWTGITPDRETRFGTIPGNKGQIRLERPRYNPFWDWQEGTGSADVNYRSRSSGLRSGTVNGNRWGLKGSEDLGDGLRAIFQLEQGFDLGTGEPSSSRAFHRQAFVGLSSDAWGTFTMGRQYSAGVEVGNLIANGWNMGDVDKVFGGVGYANRIDNSFKYKTPDFAGFQAIFLYGNADIPVTRYTADGYGYSYANDTEDRSNRTSVGLTYANGPISLGASYDRASVQDMDAIQNWNVNAAYDFEVVKLSLAYGQDRNGKLGWAGSAKSLAGLDTSLYPLWVTNTNNAGGGLPDDFKSNNYHVGLSAPIGGGTLYAGWNYSTSNLDDGNKWGDYAGSISTYQINYFYALSKRTGVYAYGSYGRNLGYLDGLKGTEAGIGLNHKF